MNGHGKSDGPVVPAKRPNNAGEVPAAEAVEERGPTKGNADRPTRPAHSGGHDVPHGLARVRQAAQRDSKMQFTALLHHVDLDRLMYMTSSVNDGHCQHKHPARIRVTRPMWSWAAPSPR